MKNLKTLLTLCVLLTCAVAQGQSLSRLIDHYIPLLQSTSDDEPGFDTVYARAKQKLFEYLEKKPIVLDTNSQSRNYLEDVHNADNSFNTYSFFYFTKGSRSHISTTFVQWKKPDGTWGVYELKTPMSVHRIYALPAKGKTLYLVLGGEPASTAVYNHYALVAQVKGQYLILDHPAFYGEACMLQYQDDHKDDKSDEEAYVEYNPKDHTLTMLNMGKNDEVSTRKGKEKKVKAKGGGRLRLKFNGKNFVPVSS